MRGRLLAGAAGAAVLLAGCSTPDAPEPTGTAVTEVSEIGVLADMTGAECAVAGSPWNIDDLQFDRDYSLAMMALDPAVASSGIGGSYSIDFTDRGVVRIQTVGYTISTTSKAVDAAGSFAHIRTRGSQGMAIAEWSEIDEDGSVVSFLDWSSDIVETAPAWDDGTAYAGTVPAWQVPGRTGVALECDSDGTGLWLRSTTPGYLDLHFVR